MNDGHVIEPGGRQRQIECGRDVLRFHRRAELPGDNEAREVVQHGGGVVPAPSRDLEIGEVGVAAKILSLCCAAASAEARAQSTDADLKLFAVHVNRTPRQSWPGYGLYLGNGLILTASHVPGTFAYTKPHVVIVGQDVPAGLVKEGSLDSVDLTLLSIDATSLPVRLRMGRMPICERAPYPGEAVVVAIPEGTARSRVLLVKRSQPICEADSTPRSPTSPPPAILAREYSTAATFACLGLSAARFSVMQRGGKIGAPVTTTRDIAKYFVPAPIIKSFIPPGVTY